MTAKPYDPTIKALVETAPEGWPVLAGLRRAPTDVIDADIATVSGAADKVLRVHDATPYLLHLEFVSGHDTAQMPTLFHVRNVLLGYRHDLHVRTVVVVLRPEADSPALDEELVRTFPGETPYDVFRYQVVRVWRLSPDPLLAGGVGTLPLAPLTAVTEAELPGIIARMDERLRRRSVRRRAQGLWAATWILMGLRYSAAVAERLLRGVVAMKESATYQAILAEGEAIGKLAGARELLLLLGEKRFGSPDTSTVSALESITDLKRLEELGLQVLSATSWRELIGKPTRRRNGGRSRSS